MNKRLSVRDIRKFKLTASKQEPLVSLVCYTAQMSRLINNIVDIILVGDSMGMTIYGHENTLLVTPQMMINHGKAVVSSTSKPHIVVDLPFASYEESPEKAFRTASRIMKHTGAQSVKLEGGEEFADRGLLSPALSMWLPNIVLGIFGILICYWQSLEQRTINLDIFSFVI